MICKRKKMTKKDGDDWFNNYSFESLKLFHHLFQFIKWEDDEPYEISKLLEGK